jgi:hypothetical protein
MLMLDALQAAVQTRRPFVRRGANLMERLYATDMRILAGKFPDTLHDTSSFHQERSGARACVRVSVRERVRARARARACWCVCMYSCACVSACACASASACACVCARACVSARACVCDDASPFRQERCSARGSSTLSSTCTHVTLMQ